jgi:RNA polymerase sigma-70 factor, ECF subfamily
MDTKNVWQEETISAMVAFGDGAPDSRRSSNRSGRSVSDLVSFPSEPTLRDHQAACMRLIAEAQSRDAFAELFAFYAPRLKSYMKRLGALEQEAEELVQDVMVTVWRKAALYDPRQASVSTWIFRVARNRRIDQRRRLAKPELDAEDPRLQPSSPEAPDHALARTQMEVRVRAELHKLPEAQRSLVQAAFYDGLSHSEIAEAFALPLGTVKSRIRLAFERLRGALGTGV